MYVGGRVWQAARRLCGRRRYGGGVRSHVGTEQPCLLLPSSLERVVFSRRWSRLCPVSRVECGVCTCLFHSL
eukprot:1586877-Prymnesium_polylepis.1